LKATTAAAALQVFFLLEPTRQQLIMRRHLLLLEWRLRKLVNCLSNNITRWARVVVS